MRPARIAVVVLVLAASGAAHARTIGHAVPVSVAFWDRDHGLAAFVVYGSTDQLAGQLAVTKDGGKSWAIRWRGAAAWNVGTIPGTHDAWAQVSARESCLECPALLLHTRDAGRTWKRAGKTPSRPSFPTRRIGFAMRSLRGNARDLLKTTDGGRTWRRVGAPCRNGWGGFAQRASVAFVSPRRGWLLCTGQPGAGSQSKALYRTSDGGATWKLLVNAHFEPGRIRLGGLDGGGYAGGISFARRGRGLLWGSRGFTYRTADAGRHWRPTAGTSPEVREGYSGWLVSHRIGYLLLWDDGRRADRELLRTADGGRSWSLVRSWPHR